MPDSTGRIVIETNALSKRFGDFLALDRLNLRVRHGTIFGLLGPNGAGKSTAIKILTTLRDASSGSARVAGFDVKSEPLQVRRHIGYVPQMLSADGALTATENLTLSARLHGLHGAMCTTRITEALAFAGLEGVAGQLVRTYLDYMAPGILAQSILFSAIFYGIAIIWERDMGIVHKLLVTPAHRTALVLGKATAAGLRGLVQAAVVYLVAIAVHVHIRWEPLPMLIMMAAVFLGSCIFSTFSLVIACIVKTRERFMGIGQVLTMPLFFASNAIYPLDLMPPWLRAVAVFNPLTYLVDALRGAMIVNGQSLYSATTSFGIMMLVFVVLVAIAARLYPGLAR